MEGKKKKKDGTLASYCFSVANFFNYLATAKKKNAFSKVRGTSALLKKEQDWKKIGSSLQKEGRSRQVELAEHDYQNVSILSFTFTYLYTLKVK